MRGGEAIGYVREHSDAAGGDELPCFDESRLPPAVVRDEEWDARCLEGLCVCVCVVCACVCVVCACVCVCVCVCCEWKVCVCLRMGKVCVCVV